MKISFEVLGHGISFDVENYHAMFSPTALIEQNGISQACSEKIFEKCPDILPCVLKITANDEKTSTIFEWKIEVVPVNRPSFSFYKFGKSFSVISGEENVPKD